MKNFILITCFGLLFGAMVTARLYIDGERMIDDTEYETLSSFTDCINMGHLEIKECELTHG